jgi:hypothetical protein
MRVLLLHADDSPLEGPWVSQRWDLVFDLARGGWAACDRWSAAFGCPVTPIDALRKDDSQIHRVRELMRLGIGRLVDHEGLDWWELSAIMFHDKLEKLVLLHHLAGSIETSAEVWITRDGFEADALRMRLGDRLRVMNSQGREVSKGLRYYLGRLQRIPSKQVLQTLGDKYDAGYRVRRHFHARPRARSKPTVLVPSSYINMSLTGCAYAEVVPDRDFLLVSTRYSGRLPSTPPNVSQEWLASYTRGFATAELEDILDRWHQFKLELASVPELAAVIDLGLTDNFRSWFADGLAIRNSWLELLNSQPIQAVLCCDDTNPYTHIPLLLARLRGLPAIACHHGALDGRHLIKRNSADVILAKGRMEEDYLVGTCGVDAGEVEIGAPFAPAQTARSREPEPDRIVFFSEPYEVTGGRATEIYRDTLPALADLAKSKGKRLVLKLHPAENLADRRDLVEKILDANQIAFLDWFPGRLTPEFFQRTWFGMTVQSSVVTECLLYGVPCFLCEWMDLWPYGYIAQFRKFGVGIGLRSPAEIPGIPEILATEKPRPEVAERCWQAIAPARFDELLSGRKAVIPEPVRMRPF